MKPWILGIAVGGIVSVGLTAALTPACAAMRPREVIRVTEYRFSGEVVDGGNACAYEWGGSLRVLRKSRAEGCPSKQDAVAQWQMVLAAEAEAQGAEAEAKDAAAMAASLRAGWVIE